MKILLAGDYRYEWYQEAAASALERQGHEVVRFAWFDFFQYPSLKGRIQIRLMLGPAFGQRRVRSLREICKAGSGFHLDVLADMARCYSSTSHGLFCNLGFIYQ